MKSEKTEKEQKTLSNDFGSPKLQRNTGEAAWLEQGALTKLPGSWPLQDTALVQSQTQPRLGHQMNQLQGTP